MCQSVLEDQENSLQEVHLTKSIVAFLTLATYFQYYHKEYFKFEIKSTTK